MTITCPRCSASMPASFKFCSNCGYQLQDAEGDRLGEGTSDEAAPRPAERRQITVMFCDLVGSVELSNQLDPEDLRDIIGRYQEASTRIVERWEGYVAQYLGDGILVYFGYPVAHEGEAERAVRAALEILKEIRLLRRKLREKYDVEIAVRLGLHTGLVVVGEVGSGQRRENLALGETPNLAARLQSVAPPNGIIISEATHRLVSGTFECTDLGPRIIKGLPREERVFLVREERLEASPLDVHGARGPIRSRGREGEVDAFRGCWEKVKAGEGRILVISGEPGIGKSHLVQLFRQELEDAPHFRVECRCSPYRRSSALHPITDWLHRVLNFYPDQPPEDRLSMIEFVAERNGLQDSETVPLLASLLSVPLNDQYQDLGYSPALRRERTEQTLMELMLRFRGDRPLVLILEDIHWADPTTKAFLSRFSLRLQELPILFLVTTRPWPETKWPEQVPVDSLPLRRLSRPQVEAIIADVAKDKLLPPQIVDQIVDRTDGVPLFVQELSKMVLESGLVVECDECFELAANAPDLAIPATLQDSLMARLDRLLPVKEVAQLCSVLGRDFSYDLARAATRLPDASLTSALDRLAAAEILISEGTPPKSRYMFGHALIQEAAYESLLKSSRLDAHRRIAENLVESRDADEARPEIIAHHFARAGIRVEAARYWCRAGQNAHERWANEEAVDYFSRGYAILEGLPPSPDLQRLRFFLSAGLAVASLQIKGYTHPSVLSSFERARALVEHIDDASASAPILRGIWTHYTVLADHRRADQLALQLEAMAASVDDPLHRMEAELAMASTAFWRGRVHEARTSYEAILASYAGLDELPPSTLSAQHPFVNALSYLSLALWYLGFQEEATQRSREAVEIADRFHHPFSQAFALTFQTALYSYFDDREQAKISAQRAVEISVRFGYPFWLAISTMIRSWSVSDEDPDAAIASIMKGLSALRSAGARIWTAHPSAQLANLLAERGRTEEGLRVIEGVVKQADSCDEMYYLPEILRIQARLLADVSRWEEAEGVTERALTLAREQQAKPIVDRILADISARMPVDSR